MTASIASSQRMATMSSLPPLSARGSSRRSLEENQWETASLGHRLFASAATELGMEARDGIRTDGSRRAGSCGGNNLGLSLDLERLRQKPSSARTTRSSSRNTSCMSSRSCREPRDIMASGPQSLTVAAARGPRKGVHTGVSLAKMRPEERDEHELRTVCEQIGLKAAQKFGTVRQAFRYLDADHDGKISRSEMRYFFRAYNFNDAIADRFYNRLDHDGSGEVDYGEFMRFVAPYVQPDYMGTCQSPDCGSETSTRTPSPHGSTQPVADSIKDMDPDLKNMFEFIGRKANEKFTNAREAFRYVDCNSDGNISRGEMQHFFRAFNLTESQANRFFDYMDADGSGELDYHEFARFLGPFLDLPGTAAIMLQRPEGSAPNRPARRNILSQEPSREPSIACASEFSEWSAIDKTSQSLTEKEMRDVMKDIGEKLPLKFKHVRDAFRPLDLSHDGKITQTEMRSFLRGFGWSHEFADRLFKTLDEDGCGAIDFNMFMFQFDAVLGPANRPAHRGDLIPDTADKLSKEVNQLAAILSEKLLTKYSSARQAFSTLDLSNDGQITLSEMRMFFRSMSMALDDATKVFKYLCKENSDTVNFDDFLALFGPVHRPGGRWRTVQELTSSPTVAVSM